MKTLKITRTELKEYDGESLDVLTYLAKALHEVKLEEQKKIDAKTRHARRRR